MRKLFVGRPHRAVRLHAAAAAILLLAPGQSGAQAVSDATAVKASEPATQGVASRAIDAVRAAAKSASDVFNRVPCSVPKGVTLHASLPHVARKLASGEHVTIIAFGSSSTVSVGASSPAFQYPNRLADQLRRHYPGADIAVLNQGVSGEDTPEMMRRLKTSVIDQKPDLVIWQLGTNTIVRGGDIDATMGLLQDGVEQLKASGTDVVLVDPQYTPVVTAKGAAADKMVGIIGRAARLMKVGLFPRFEVMREWHTDRALPFDDFVGKDGLHMNDWGYACFAQLLGDSIINSVDEVKAGVDAPSSVVTYRPL